MSIIFLKKPRIVAQSSSEIEMPWLLLDFR